MSPSTTKLAYALLLGITTAQRSIWAQSQEAARGEAAMWGALESGPYAVGFRVAYELDRSRVWDPTPDSLRTGEIARPIRISLWYPVPKQRVVGKHSMREAGYFFRRAPAPYFAKLDSLIERADVISMRDFIFGKSDSLFQKFVSLPSAAYEGAKPATGRFPLLMYSAGYNNRSHDNSVLAEYLASHGYVVATVPQVGTRSTRLTLRINSVDLETQGRDLEFAMGKVQELAFVNRDKLAVIGYSMGGIIALQIAARNPNVDAVVGLDASYRAPRFVALVLASPYFNPRAVRASILSLQSGNPAEANAQDSAVLDSLRFADRYVARVGRAMHGDFSDFAMLAPLFPVDVQGRTAMDSRESYQVIARYVLHFLDKTLKGDRPTVAGIAEGNGLAQGLVRMRFQPRVDVPSEDDFALLIQRHGLGAAMQALDRARGRYPGIDVIDQPTLNRIGYGLMEGGRARIAVDVFRLNTLAHPNSSDAFDSLGEGLVAAGDIPGAVSAYQQVIEVLPRDVTLTDPRRTEIRTETKKKISALQNHPDNH
jgi:pimeloyl-ACP methyl ester carboxylesterase